MSQLSEADRAFLSGHLDRSRDLLQTALDGVRPDQWAFRPGEDAWSIAECADHISYVEKRIFLLVSKVMPTAPPDPQKAAALRYKTEIMLRSVPAREKRVKVPFSGEKQRHCGTPEEFLTSFASQRVVLEHYVRKTEDSIHDRVAPHPMFQDLNGYQWLLMIPLHTERHVAQISEVKAHVDYPR